MMLLLSVLAVSAAGTDQCAVVDARNTTETLHAVQSRVRAAVSLPSRTLSPMRATRGERREPARSRDAA